jgi:hypothetical protein
MTGVASALPSTLASTLAVAIALVAAGCASAPAQDATLFAAGPILPASAPVHGDDLVRPPGSIAWFRIAAGARTGEAIVQRVVREGDRILIREEREDGRAQEVVHLTTGDDGGLLGHALDKQDDDTRSAFLDPLPYAPRALHPGAPAAAASRLEAYELGTADGPAPKRKAVGRCRRELRLLGDADIVACGRTLRVAVVEMLFRAELDLARVRATERIYVERGKGIVAEERSERVLILGVIPRDSDSTIVLDRVEDPAR